jgi:hypothetical protein
VRHIKGGETRLGKIEHRNSRTVQGNLNYTLVNKKKCGKYERLRPALCALTQQQHSAYLQANGLPDAGAGDSTCYTCSLTRRLQRKVVHAIDTRLTPLRPALQTLLNAHYSGCARRAAGAPPSPPLPPTPPPQPQAEPEARRVQLNRLLLLPACVCCSRLPPPPPRSSGPGEPLR